MNLFGQEVIRYIIDFGRCENDFYRLLYLEKICGMFNVEFKEYGWVNLGCDGDLIWDLDFEERCGLGIRLWFKCNICIYVFKMYSFYVEVEFGFRGRKVVVINYGL